MNPELQQISEEIRKLGGDPVSLLRQALSEQVKKVRSPVVISCQSCKTQDVCSFRAQVTRLVQFPAPHVEVPILGKEFYSQIATACSWFEVIGDPLFGVQKEGSDR